MGLVTKGGPAFIPLRRMQSKMNCEYGGSLGLARGSEALRAMADAGKLARKVRQERDATNSEACSTIADINSQVAESAHREERKREEKHRKKNWARARKTFLSVGLLGLAVFGLRKYGRILFVDPLS